MSHVRSIVSCLEQHALRRQCVHLVLSPSVHASDMYILTSADEESGVQCEVSLATKHVESQQADNPNIIIVSLGPRNEAWFHMPELRPFANKLVYSLGEDDEAATLSRLVCHVLGSARRHERPPPPPR